MTSLLDYIEDIRKRSGNPFQSDYRSEVDTLISLAFPSTQKPRKKNVGIGRIDTDSMSEEEYNRWFQGQGRLAESHPVASVVGPLKGANVLRKWALGQAAKPKPTTAPLAITDQTQAPLAEPLRLEGPPDLPMLTYDGPYDQAIAEDLDPFIDGGEANPPPMQPLTPEQADAAERHWNTQQDQLRDEYYLGLEAATEDIDPDAAYPAEVNQEYNPDYDGGFPEQGDFDDVADHDYTADELIQLGDDDPSDLLAASNPPLSDEEFYTKPKGYYSVLDKIIEGDSLTKAEKESAVREMKYRMMSSDNKLFDEIIHDPTRDIYAEMTADEDGNIIDSPIPGINDIEAIKKFKEEKPLEFTVRHSWDTVGEEPGDKATHLYFGGTNLKRQSEEFREHFFSDGRPAQAFITYNEKGGSFNIEESQSEMRGEGNPYMNQVITKLAQQTVLNWAKTGLNTITIPTGESIFEKYEASLNQGSHLWPEERELLKLKDDDNFNKKAIEFYNDPILRNQTKDLLKLAGKESKESSIDAEILRKVDKLRDLKGNYQGKVKHYNEYVKQVKKALKQQGADIGHFGKTVADAWETVIEIKNPEETKRKTEIDGFPMAMLLKKTKKRQVA